MKKIVLLLTTLMTMASVSYAAAAANDVETTSANGVVVAAAKVKSHSNINNNRVAQFAQLRRTASEAEARIQASDSQKELLLTAIRSKNMEQIKSVLLRNGFSNEQLKDAKIVTDTGALVRYRQGNAGVTPSGGHPNGNPSKKVINIHVTFRPLTIHITISD